MSGIGNSSTRKGGEATASAPSSSSHSSTAERYLMLWAASRRRNFGDVFVKVTQAHNHVVVKRGKPLRSSEKRLMTPQNGAIRKKATFSTSTTTATTGGGSSSSSKSQNFGTMIWMTNSPYMCVSGKVAYDKDNATSSALLEAGVDQVVSTLTRDRLIEFTIREYERIRDAIGTDCDPVFILGPLSSEKATEAALNWRTTSRGAVPRALVGALLAEKYGVESAVNWNAFYALSPEFVHIDEKKHSGKLEFTCQYPPNLCEQQQQ